MVHVGPRPGEASPSEDSLLSTLPLILQKSHASRSYLAAWQWSSKVDAFLALVIFSSILYFLMSKSWRFHPWTSTSPWNRRCRDSPQQIWGPRYPDRSLRSDLEWLKSEHDPAHGWALCSIELIWASWKAQNMAPLSEDQHVSRGWDPPASHRRPVSFRDRWLDVGKSGLDWIDEYK